MVIQKHAVPLISKSVRDAAKVSLRGKFYSFKVLKISNVADKTMKNYKVNLVVW